MRTTVALAFIVCVAGCGQESPGEFERDATTGADALPDGAESWDAVTDASSGSDCVSALSFPEMARGTVALPAECHAEGLTVVCDPPCERNPDSIPMAIVSIDAVCQGSGEVCTTPGIRFPAAEPVEWAAWEGVIGDDEVLLGGENSLSVENAPDSWKFSGCLRTPCCLPPRQECECVQDVDSGLVDAELFVRLRFPPDRLASLNGHRVIAIGYYYEVIGQDPWLSAAIIEARYLCPAE